MTTATAGTIPIRELAGALGAPVELALDLALRAGAKPVTDWKGAVLIPEKIASKVLADHREEQDAAYRRTVEFQTAHRRWETDREQVRVKAFRATLAEAAKREAAEIERLAVGGSAAWGDETGRGWAAGGGFPARFDRPSPAVHARAIQAGRDARDRYDVNHPEPSL
jgi:hypothetical protein